RRECPESGEYRYLSRMFPGNEFYRGNRMYKPGRIARSGFSFAAKRGIRCCGSIPLSGRHFYCFLSGIALA
ncbi:hypothetical protein JTM42_36145, partial [Pseudomonas aeruginosa]|nr:hypothetical protein [Pseudomonas aeruginosa]